MQVKFNSFKQNTVQNLYKYHLITHPESMDLIHTKDIKQFKECITDVIQFKWNQLSDMCDISDKTSENLDSNTEKLFNNVRSKIDYSLTWFAKLLSVEDTDYEVLKTKKILTDFGIKYAKLDNNADFAKKCLLAVKVLKSNDLKLPFGIIGTRYLPFCMTTNNKVNKHVVLNPEIDTNGFGSTDSPLHIIVHEGIHVNQPNSVKLAFEKLPERFNDTISQLSIYADNNCICEVHAELKTKQLLDSYNFTSDEEELLDYIENIMKKYK